jgi:hypothetical protein
MPFPDTTSATTSSIPSTAGSPRTGSMGARGGGSTPSCGSSRRRSSRISASRTPRWSASRRRRRFPGDVAVFVAGNFVVGSGFDVREVRRGTHKPDDRRRLPRRGLQSTESSFGAPARIITSGIVPALVAGIGAQQARSSQGSTSRPAGFASRRSVTPCSARSTSRATSTSPGTGRPPRDPLRHALDRPRRETLVVDDSDPPAWTIDELLAFLPSWAREADAPIRDALLEAVRAMAHLALVAHRTGRRAAAIAAVRRGRVARCVGRSEEAPPRAERDRGGVPREASRAARRDHAERDPRGRRVDPRRVHAPTGRRARTGDRHHVRRAARLAVVLLRAAGRSAALGRRPGATGRAWGAYTFDLLGISATGYARFVVITADDVGASDPLAWAMADDAHRGVVRGADRGGRTRSCSPHSIR